MKRLLFLLVISGLLLAAGVWATGDYFDSRQGDKQFITLVSEVGGANDSAITVDTFELYGPMYKWNTVNLSVVIAQTLVSTSGFNKKDTFRIRLFTDLAGISYELADLAGIDLPDTLYYASVGADTTLKHNLWIEVYVGDTTADTVATIPYEVSWSGILKD